MTREEREYLWTRIHNIELDHCSMIDAEISSIEQPASVKRAKQVYEDWRKIRDLPPPKVAAAIEVCEAWSKKVNGERVARRKAAHEGATRLTDTLYLDKGVELAEALAEFAAKKF